MAQETKKIGGGLGSQYDVVTIDPNMPVHRLIFLLASSLEASNGRAKVVAVEDLPNRRRLHILVRP